MPCALPEELRADLPDAPIAGAGDDAEGSATDDDVTARIELVRADVPAWIVELGVVEDVEEFDAKIESVVLVDDGPLQHAEIGVVKSGTVEKAPIDVAERP